MSEPLNAERMNALRMEARLRTWTLHDPEGPVANALETVSLLDEVESARAKLAAIRQMQPYDAREVGRVLDYDSVHDILNGGVA